MSEKEAPKTVYAVLSKIDSLKQDKRRIDMLKENDTFVMRTILQAAFSPKINFEMPTGIPPFEKPAQTEELTDNMVRVLGQCINKRLKYYEREAIFTRLCSRVHPDDVKVLVAMKDKELTKLFPSIDIKFVASVFPNLLK